MAHNEAIRKKAVRLSLKGMSTAKIAKKMELSYFTVHFWVKNLKRKKKIVDKELEPIILQAKKENAVKEVDKRATEAREIQTQVHELKKTLLGAMRASVYNCTQELQCIAAEATRIKQMGDDAKRKEIDKLTAAKNIALLYKKFNASHDFKNLEAQFARLTKIEQELKDDGLIDNTRSSPEALQEELMRMVEEEDLD